MYAHFLLTFQLLIASRNSAAWCVSTIWLLKLPRAVRSVDFISGSRVSVTWLLCPINHPDGDSGGAPYSNMALVNPQDLARCLCSYRKAIRFRSVNSLHV